MNTRRTLCLLCVLALALGCDREPPSLRPSDDSLVVALATSPIHLDPRIGTDQASARLFEVVFNGLVAKDAEWNLVPDLAQSWQILDEGRRLRFHLQPDVRFHDGRELSADDVVWTYGTIVDGQVTTAKRGAFGAVEEVVALGPLAVEFRLREPVGSFLTNLTSFVGIVPDGTLPADNHQRPIGTGPFRFVERRGQDLVLAAFDDHFRGRPRLDRVVFKHVPDATVRALELQKGSVHLVADRWPADLVPAFREDPRFRVVEELGTNYQYLGFNLEDRALADPRVRRAIAHAVDRERLVRTLWRGLGRVTETMIPPGHWAWHDGLEPIPFDPERARRLLDEAGFPHPEGGGPRLRLDYHTSTDQAYLMQAQVVQAMLREVGIDIRIRSFEFATFYSDLQRGGFQMFSLIWTGIVDPDILALALHSDRVPPRGANRVRFRNEEFDRLVEAGVRSLDPAERRPHYLAAQEVFARELPYLSLFFRYNVAVMPRELEGFRSFPSGELLSIPEVYWRE